MRICVLANLLFLCSLFQLRVGSLIIGFERPHIWIIVSFTKRLGLFIEGLCEIKPSPAFICLGETVINVRRIRVTLDICLECRNRVFRFSVEQKLISHLVDEILGHRNDIAESFTELPVMLLGAFQATQHCPALEISRPLPIFINLSQSEVMATK